MLDTGYKWVINCRCLYARMCSHCPSPFDSKCERACLCAWMCNRESNCKRERETGAEFLMPPSVFCIHFFSPPRCRPTWKCLHKHHTDSVTHAHGARFDCTWQGIHYCFQSMGKSLLNAHPRCMATDVAFTTEYGWMHTHDVGPRMLPSQQNMGEYTPTTYSHRCCRVWVNAHPRRTAMDVAFIKSKGAWTPTTYSVQVFRRRTVKVKGT